MGFYYGKKSKIYKATKGAGLWRLFKWKKTTRQIAVELNMSKYESKGEDGLEDRCGKRKSEGQLTDLEKTQQRIAELERINRR